MSEEPKKVTHKIGGARTIATAVLVCEYLRSKCAKPLSDIPADTIHYIFHEPTATNGWWSADIVVDVWESKPESYWHEIVGTCRAFVAGRGEIW